MKVTKYIVAAAILGALSLANLQGESVVQAAESDQLDELVVTAQRREQRLQDVPVAVSVVSGAELERQGIKSLQDISTQMANVKIEIGTLTNPITIRGVGSGNNSGFEQSVATFADGVYRSRSRATGAALFDIDQVEVLKGPQTTFFGANAIAGALNITTRKPSDTFGYNASALYEIVAGEYNFEGGVNLPVTDGLSVRLAGRRSGMEGFIKMQDGSGYGPNDSSRQGRVAVRWRVGDDFESNFRYDAARSRTLDAVPLEVLNCPPGAPYPVPFGQPAGKPPTNCSLALAVNPKLITSNFHSASPDSWANYDFSEAAWTNSWTLKAGSITSITSYFSHQADNRTQLIPLPFPKFTVDGYDPLPSNVLEKYHQFTQELRFQSNTGGRFDYMFGAYYSKDGWDNTSGTGFYFIPFGAILSGPPFAGLFHLNTSPTDAYTGIPRVDTQDETVSAFASATIRATDRVSVNLGGRYSQITKDGQRNLTFGTSANNTVGSFVPFPSPLYQVAACIILTCDNNPFTPARLRESKFMPSAGLQYNLSDGVMTYLTYTNGFKAGGFSGAATANTFGPETVDSYEAGLKSTLLNHRLIVNADVFRMQYKGLQETAYTQTLASIVLNAAQSISQGAELNASWKASSAIVLHADVAYLDSTYQNFKNAPCTSVSVLQGTCGTASTGAQDMSGKRRAYSPQWSGNVSATATVPVGDLELRIDPSVYFTSNYFENAAADPLFHQGGYAKYDLRFGFGPSDSSWELALIGKNLGDKEVFSSMLEMPGSAGTIEGLVERRRYIAAQVSFRH